MSRNSRRLAHYDGDGNLAAISRGIHYGERAQKRPTKKANGHVVRIKLPRRILKGCAPQKLSDAFSHKEDLEGKHAIIWCTDDDRQISHAFLGVVEKISTHGARRFALRVMRMLDPSTLTFA